MKSFFYPFLINLLSFVYLTAFFYGYFNDKIFFFLIGGLGMIISMHINTSGLAKERTIFYRALILGAIIGAIFSTWYKGAMWTSMFFIIGQIPGFIALLFNRNRVDVFEEWLEKYGDEENSMKEIQMNDWIFMIILISLPYLLTTYVFL